MRLWTLPLGFYQANCYIVAGEGPEAFVIDPGDDGGAILDLVGREGLRVRFVLLTHGHWDHVGAVPEVVSATGAGLHLHAGDAELMREAVSGPVEVAGFLSQGDELAAGDGDLRLQVLHSPGHTPGSLCFLIDDAIFTGDTLFAGNVGRTDFPGGSHADLVNSLRERILPLPDAVVVYPGHGPASTIGKERRENPFLAGLR